MAGLALLAGSCGIQVNELATIIVLCRNNPAALIETLYSVCSQDTFCELLILDGSDNTSCQMALDTFRHRGKLVYLQAPPDGPYAAMNAALALVSTPWLQFLHSGDAFADSFCLGELLNQAKNLETSSGLRPAAVFGQAWIEAPESMKLRWLSPDPRMRKLSRWLRLMVPCHQSVLFSTSWAQQHPYDLRSQVCADRPVMRLALASAGEKAYLPRPICRYNLNGLSSRLPNLSELFSRLAEPDRRPLERLGELGKFMLSPLGTHYFKLMRIRAKCIGWLCR